MDVVPEALHSIKRNNLLENEKREISELSESHGSQNNEDEAHDEQPEKAANYEIVFEDDKKFAY